LEILVGAVKVQRDNLACGKGKRGVSSIEKGKRWEE